MKNPEFLARLFYRYSRGELTASQLAALETWRKEFPRNEELFQLLTDPEVMRQTSIDIENSRKHVFELIREKIPGLWQNAEKPKVISFRFTRVAAALLVLVLGAGIYKYIHGRNGDIEPGSYKANLVGTDGVAKAIDDFSRGLSDGLSGIKRMKDENGNDFFTPVNLPHARKDAYNILSTPRGGFYSILLPDSSRVYLNAESSLKYPVNFNQDTIQLFVEGEAFFDIKRNPLHPFFLTLDPGHLKLSISNARFNVINYDHEPVDVTVIEGSTGILPVYEGDSPSRILADNHLLMMNGFQFIQPSKEADNIIAWRKGWFKFTKQRLEDILPAISRWYDVAIIYPKNSPQALYDLDIIRDAELSEVIKALQHQGAPVSLSKRTIIVGP
jgi:transmembrane sensor